MNLTLIFYAILLDCNFFKLSDNLKKKLSTKANLVEDELLFITELNFKVA